MRPFRSLVAYGLAVLAGGALLAPWLYWLAQWGAAHFSGLSSLATQPFHRFVNRSLLILAVAGLWPFLHCTGARSAHDMGLPHPAGEWKKLCAGLVLGLASLAVVALLAIAFDARKIDLDHAAPQVARHLANAVSAAVAVGVLEELFFRGALFGSLRKACRWPVALTVSSMIYALAHFFQKAESPAEIHWMSGVLLLPQMLRGFANAQTLVPGFFNLTLAGLVLGLAYQRTGNLYFSIGLHAGWIFWLKTYGFFTMPTPGANSWLWGSSKLMDGWLALPLLAAVLVIGIRFRAPDIPPQPFA